MSWLDAIWLTLLPFNSIPLIFSFFFNDTATTEIYTLSLHDALPISGTGVAGRPGPLELSTPCWRRSPGRGGPGRAHRALPDQEERAGVSQPVVTGIRASATRRATLPLA